ncbi:MAG: ribonuclease P protein component [Candidatus Peregrinibacteria bacterium]
MLAKKNRLGDKKHLEELRKKGHEYRTPSLTFRFLPKMMPPSQFAITVSLKVGKKAVERNRLRRQISEGIRIQLPLLTRNIFALVIARPAIQKSDYQEIQKAILQFFNHLQSS